MKTLKVIATLAVMLVIVAGVLYWHNMHEEETEEMHGELAQTINQCDLIAGKAAAELPEVLPFQKLEKSARQSRVLDRCIQDRGYQQNPAWVASANAHAGEIAHAQNISHDEAFETLRRQAMLKDEGTGASYWRKRS